MVVTPSEGEYLKFLYRRQIEEGEKLRTSVLARTFDVHSATVTEVLQKLARKGLIQYTRYYGAKFTDDGVAMAQHLIRKHRLLEVLFVKLLHYDAETACEEASKLDYYCSEYLSNAICRAYDHPRVCPCNKAIPRDEACSKT